jgi:hypothetical protein
VIESLVTALVQSAPALDPAVVRALVAELGAVTEERAALAAAIARCIELVARGAIDPGISLPHLAMACATLTAPTSDARVLAATQYEIETLLPVPARPKPVEPDVPLTALVRPKP